MKSKLVLFFLLFHVSYGKGILEYYNIALENSYFVQEAKYNLDASEANIEQTSSKDGFNVNWSMSSSRVDDKSDISIEDNTYNETNYNLALNKSLYNNENNLALNKSELEYKIELLNYNKSVQEFGTEFLVKYFTLYKEQKSLENNIKNERFAKKVYLKSKKLYKLKLLNEVDFLKVKVNFTEAQNNARLSQLKYDKSKEILELFLGTTKIEKFMNFSIKSISSLNVSQEQNFSQNIDLSIINLETLSLKKELESFKNWYYPSLNFSVNYSSLQTGDPTTEEVDQTRAKITLSGDLYQGGYTKSSIRKSLALLKAKNHKKKFLNNRLYIEVNENLLELKSLIAQYEILNEKLNQTQLEFKLLERKNQFGLIDFSKSIELQNQIFALETQTVDILIEALQLYIAVEFEFTQDTYEIIDKINLFLKSQAN